MPLRYHDQRHRHKLKSRGLNFKRVPDAQSVPMLTNVSLGSCLDSLNLKIDVGLTDV